MRPVTVFPDYLVKLVIPASRAILKPAVICRCVSLVRSLKEKWERNGKGIHEGCHGGQSYGNGKGTGNLPMKKICRRKPAFFF